MQCPRYVLMLDVECWMLDVFLPLGRGSVALQNLVVKQLIGVASPYTQVFPANPLVMQHVKQRTRQAIFRPVGKLYDFACLPGRSMSEECYLKCLN